MMLAKKLSLSMGYFRNKKSTQRTPLRAKATLLLIIICIASITALPILQSTNVGAATTSDSKGVGAIDWQIKSLIYYKSITECMKYTALTDNAAGLDFWNGYNNRIKPSNADSGKWFAGGLTQAIGVYMKDVTGLKVDKNGTIDCANTSLISNALSMWGLSATDVLCNSGFQRADINNPTPENCLSGTTNFKLSGSQSNSATKFAAYIKAQVYNNQEPKLTPAQLYIFYRHSLNQSCIPNIDTIAPSTDTDYTNGYSKIQWVGGTPAGVTTGSYPPGNSLKPGSTVTVRPWANAENGDTSVPPYNSGGYIGTWETCSNLAKLMSNNAADFLAWVAASPDQASAAIVNDNSGDGGGTPTTASCAIDGIGWLVCPVVHFLAYVADGAFGFLSNNFLSTNIKIFDTSSPTYSAWQIMRNIANVAFVIAFLIIIFSQLTSIGITNYGVKKLLPRIVVAAILVNISYFVCQIAVDLSNILGYSLKDLLVGLAPTTAKTAQGWLSTGGSGFTEIATGIIGGALIGVALYAALSALVPVLIAAVVALVMILFILVARQALIIILIVISPLAFVAFLLPNTEKLFKQWQKVFTSMLLLFPIVALVFGLSSLASIILSSTFNGVIDGDTKNWFGQVIAAAVMILPLFVVPGLLKKALDGVGSIGATLNGLGAKMGGALGKPAGTWTKEAMERRDNRLDNNALNNGGRFNLRKRRLLRNARRDMADQNQQSESKRATTDYIAREVTNDGSSLRAAMVRGGSADAGTRAEANAITAREKMDSDEINAITTVAKSKNMDIGTATSNFEQAVRDGNINKSRAYQNVLLSNGGKGKNSLQDAYKKLENERSVGPNGPMPHTPKDSEMYNKLKSDLKGAGLTGSNATLAKYSYTDESISGLESQEATFSTLNTVEWAGQTQKNLELAKSNGSLNAQVAATILKTSGAQNLLDEDKRALLNKIVADAPITPQPQTEAQTIRTPILDRNGNPLPPSQNNPNNRQ